MENGPPPRITSGYRCKICLGFYECFDTVSSVKSISPFLLYSVWSGLVFLVVTASSTGDTGLERPKGEGTERVEDDSWLLVMEWGGVGPIPVPVGTQEEKPAVR